MSIINYAAKVINFKLVYYGPGMAGKTANLQFVHRCLPDDNRGNMISLATGDDRTLFFDFLPVSATSVRGFTTKFQLYTVPGQSRYNMTRRLVLRGVDGVVFVADSQWERLRENVESLRNLDENLKEYGLALATTPCVLQYNKRDLGHVAPLDYLEYLLNRGTPRVPFFEAVALHRRAGRGGLRLHGGPGPPARRERVLGALPRGREGEHARLRGRRADDPARDLRRAHDDRYGAPVRARGRRLDRHHPRGDAQASEAGGGAGGPPDRGGDAARERPSPRLIASCRPS